MERFGSFWTTDRRVRDREAPGSNPGPPTKIEFKIGDFEGCWNRRITAGSQFPGEPRRCIYQLFHAFPVGTPEALRKETTRCHASSLARWSAWVLPPKSNCGPAPSPGGGMKSCTRKVWPAPG